MQRTQRTPGLLGTAAAAVLLAMTLGLAGCGSDGDDGAQGPQGDQGEQGEQGASGTPADPTQDPLSLAATHAQPLPAFNEASITDVRVIQNNPTNIEITFEVDGYTDEAIAVELSLAKWLPERGTWINMLQREVGNPNVIRGGNLRYTVEGGMNGQFITTFNSDRDDRWGAPGVGLAAGLPIDFSNGAVWRNQGTADESAASHYCGDDTAYCAFVQGIIDDIEANATWDDRAIYRVGVTSRASPRDLRFNTVVDFIPAQGILPDLTNPVMTQASCSSCHGENIAFDGHGGRRFEPAVCTQCHNDFTYDGANSTPEVGGWTNIGAALMVHKIHAGIEGYDVAGSDYSDVRFPDWLFGRNRGPRNCTTCHEDVRPVEQAHWNEFPTTRACLSCHEGDSVVQAFPGAPAGVAAHTTPVSQLDPQACIQCHGTGDDSLQIGRSADEFHGVTAALAVLEERKDYQVKIVSVDTLDLSEAKVAWQVVNDQGTPYPLSESAVANMFVGIGWGYGDDWVNDGVGPRDSGAKGDPLDAVVTPVNTGFDVDTATTTLSLAGLTPDAALDGRNGYVAIYPREQASVLGVRPHSGLVINGNEVVPNTAIATMTLGTDATNPSNDRRTIVSAEGCNSCHTTTFRHGSIANDDIMGCVACHNAGSLSRNENDDLVVGDLVPVQGSVDFMFMVHAIHSIGDGNRERFDRRRDHGYTDRSQVSTILDCQSCHLPDTYAFPVDRDARIGVIADGFKDQFVENGSGVNSAEASVCFSCHESGVDLNADPIKAHMVTFGATMDGSGTHAGLLGEVSACTGCHTPSN